MELNLAAMLAFTAGGFIYIATSDLVPALRGKALRSSIPAQFAFTLVGIMSMQLILWWESANFLLTLEHYRVPASAEFPRLGQL